MKYTFIYFSTTLETKKVNDYIKKNLDNYNVINITNNKTRSEFNFNESIDFLILSFPIYAQDIPFLVRDFIMKLRGKLAVINITYGGISYGKGLYHAYKILKKNGFKIIGASLLPARHSYSDIDYKTNLTKLDPLIKKIKYSNQEIIIPKHHKNILASIAPTLRSKLSVKKPKVNLDNCIRCFKCKYTCPVKAITDNLKINHNCIRCMHCVEVCTHGARKLKITKILNIYLKRYLYKNIDYTIYI